MEDDTIGVDIGGTKCSLARVNRDGKVLDSTQFLSIPTRGVEPFLQELITHIQALKSPQTRAIGIGIAAQVSRETGFVSFAPNLKWHNVPLGTHLQEALGLPISILNDVHAAAYGEWCCGSGQGEEDLVALFLGTGVGGAVLSQGKWLLGATGCAGELGHLCICMGGRFCGCGNRGCLEAYLGGVHLTRRLKERVAEHPESAKVLLKLTSDNPNNLTPHHLAQGCALQDPFSLDCAEEAFLALVAGGISILHAYNPRTLILGGGLLQGFPDWIERLEKSLRARALPAAGKAISVRPALLKTQAGSIGAALYAANALT